MEQIRKPRKGEIISDIKVVDTGEKGFGIGKKDGLVFFIPTALPGDTVTIQVKKVKHSTVESKLVSIESFSDKRQSSFCTHFENCGGCVWQELAYPFQLEQKNKKVIDAFEKIAKIPVPFAKPILGSPEIIYYRNKMDFGFCNKQFVPYEKVKDKDFVPEKGLGFHVSGVFDKILDIHHCFLQGQDSNEIRNFFRERTEHLDYYDFKTHEGIMRNLIIRNNSKGDLMVILAVNTEFDELKLILQELIEKFPKIISLYYVINKKFNDSLSDQEHILFHGNVYLEEEISGVKYQFGPKSFFQTNMYQTPNLFLGAVNLVDITSEDVVYDLYTGVGTLALLVASRFPKKVIGIEYIEEATKMADHNAKLNGFENTQFFAGDMKKILTHEFIAKHGKPSVIITDPPRAGMDLPVIERILEIEAKTIIYVSCNPGTQARDVQLLSSKYELTALQPVDMFPHTYHVENIVKLELRK